jgi:integrase
MAQIIQRVWRSGPRKVKRVAYGYTLMVNGRQERKYDGAWDREAAEKALAARLLNVAPLDSSTPEPSNVVTFRAMTERYLQVKEIGRKRTLEFDRWVIAKLLAHFGADTPLAEITAPRITEYRIQRLTTKSERLKRHLTPASVNRELCVLRSVLRLAADDDYGYLEKAPRVRMEKEPQGRLRYLTEDEASRLLTECRRAAEHPVSPRRSTQLYPVVVLALETGMRRGEILGLEWSRVNFSRGVIQLEMTKNGTRREIPMRRAVYDVLSALPKSGTRLFHGSVRGAFESAVARAQIEGFRFHDLRHTFASWFMMRGGSIYALQQILGQKTIEMTMRYAHLAPDHLRSEMTKTESSDFQHKLSTKTEGSLVSTR